MVTKSPSKTISLPQATYEKLDAYRRKRQAQTNKDVTFAGALEDLFEHQPTEVPAK
jgi:hypothetical protein